jgi:ERCC4-type nuclease
MPKDTYKWVLDSRERNKKFKKFLDPNEYIVKQLTLSHFVVLPAGKEDLDCGDFTNENGDGIIEFKEFGDFVGSTTRQGVYHLREQVIKMYATGIPFIVIVYGSRFAFQAKSGCSDGLILDALQEAASICSTYRCALIFVKDLKEALEVAKTFIRKAPGKPRRMPVYNLFKKSEESSVAVICGFTGWAEKKARVLMKSYKSLRNFFKVLDGLITSWDQDKVINEVVSFTKQTSRGINKPDVKKLINEYTMEYIGENENGQGDEGDEGDDGDDEGD